MTSVNITAPEPNKSANPAQPSPTPQQNQEPGQHNQQQERPDQQGQAGAANVIAGIMRYSNRAHTAPGPHAQEQSLECEGFPGLHAGRRGEYGLG
jgi:hypothetical protein